MSSGDKVVKLHSTAGNSKLKSPENQLSTLLKQNEQLNQQIYQLVKSEKKLYKTQIQLGRKVRLTTALNQLALKLGKVTQVDPIFEDFANFIDKEFFMETTTFWVRPPYLQANKELFFNKLPGSSLKKWNQEKNFFKNNIQQDIPPSSNVTFSSVDKLNSKIQKHLRTLLDLTDLPQDALFFSFPFYFEPKKLGGWIGALTVSKSDLGYHDQLPGKEDLPFLESLRLQIEMSLHQVFLHNENILLVQSLEEKVQKRTLELKNANTKLKKNLEELNKTQKQLVHAQKMEAVGTLTGGIAHDFNNKLGALTLIGRLILDKTDKENPLRPDLEQILDIANKSATLVSQLLSFGRKQILKPKKVDLNELVSILHSMMARILPETINMDVVLSETPLWVEVDWNQMEQALLNIVINSRDAMPDGGTIKIETCLKRIDTKRRGDQSDLDPGEYASVKISDSGRGMDETLKAQVFEPFFTTKEVGKGSGLGLAMVHGFIKQSSGSILLESQPDYGTSLEIFLPLVEKIETPSFPAKGSGIKPKRKNKNKKILVIEDDAILRAIIQKTLNYAGYEVSVAFNGKDGLDCIKNTKAPFSLVLTDVVMPEINGGEFAQFALKRYPDLKIIFMSGYPRDFLKNRGLSDSVKILQKPFEPQILLDAIQEMFIETNECEESV